MGYGCYGRGGWSERYSADPGGGAEFGGGRRGWRGRGGGGRFFGPGDLRLLLLSLIEEQPRHGYDLIRAVEDLFGGAYAPSPGAVYPTLTYLEEQGLIAAEAGDASKRVYALTEAGRVWLAENRDMVDAVVNRVRVVGRMMSGQRAPEAVRETFKTLEQALALKSGPWTEAETARVIEALARAIREISGA